MFLIDFDDVLLLHFQLLRSFVVVDPAAVEEEPEGADWDADPLRVGLLELAHLGGHLDSEVDLVRVLPDDLQLDVLGLLGHVDAGLTKFEVDDVVAAELGFYLMLKAILGAPFIAIF